MVDKNKESQKTGFTPIKPASVDLTGKSPAEEPANTRKNPKSSLFIWLGLGALLLILMVVIFFLPRWSSVPTIEPTETSTLIPPTTSQTVTSVGDSPWESAQESQLRKDSQAILEKMLDAQKSLTDHAVTLWAEEEYAQAVQYAQAGDAFYNQRDFSGARNQYQQALTIFDGLVEQIDDVFKKTIETGNVALAENDSVAAKKAFQLALAIDSLDRKASEGFERAETLDQVIALINKGERLLNKDQANEAKTLFEQALKLDGKATTAQQGIKRSEERILEQKFNHAMSSGFNAMENKHYEQARQSFYQAQKLNPSSPEARSAIAQINHHIKTGKIANLLSQGKELEEKEQWKDAMTKYNSALELDSGLAEALEGRNRSNLRLKIHERLEQILAQPDRLYNQEVYADTVTFYKKVNAVSNPGNILGKQLNTLKNILAKAKIPVVVTLQSDNKTKVTLYKVGEQGYFESKELTLPPGRYVAVGQREGYRDVRVEFMLEPDKSAPVITIQANEKVMPGK